MVDKYRSIIEEISSLQVENENIRCEIIYLLGDFSAFENEQSYLEENGLSLIQSIGIASSPLILTGFILGLIKIFNPEMIKPFSEITSQELLGMSIGIVPYIALSLLLFKSEHTSRKEKNEKRLLLEINNYEDVLNNLSIQIQELRDIYNNNLESIDILEKKLLNIKETVFEDLITEHFSHNEEKEGSIQKTIGAIKY